MGQGPEGRFVVIEGELRKGAVVLGVGDTAGKAWNDAAPQPAKRGVWRQTVQLFSVGEAPKRKSSPHPRAQQPKQEPIQKPATAENLFVAEARRQVAELRMIREAVQQIERAMGVRRRFYKDDPETLTVRHGV